jgi:alpha-beta hydrolase superfamily lysophospholipase
MGRDYNDFPMARSKLRRWLIRFAISIAVVVLLILFVVFPVAASFLITNSRFRFPERGPTTPEAVGLQVMPAEFTSSDGVPLKGWWNPGDAAKPVILYSHGLNRSRLEMLERGAESNRRGYGILLFDLRNHGESGRAYTTLGIHESRDICAASQFVKMNAPGRPQVLWGVSMGASSALIAAKQCPGFAAAVSDSSFLSFRETVAHHLGLYFRLPAFPISNLIIATTAFRMGLDPDAGDIEQTVKHLDIPILFIAGSADRRMPTELANRLLTAAKHPGKKLVVVPNAKHGEAFNTNKDMYLNSVYEFLRQVP